MSKEIDNLLDNLIKEIDLQDGQPAPKEPKPASTEAKNRAEAIAKDVNKSYRRPPEPVKQSIPAPQINPVVEPEPTSHFTDEPSSDPAIRMHDRLDESTLPAPDADRRPNQIMDIDGRKSAKPRRKKSTRSMPAPAETPKRKIPHINVPDELPPDVTSDYDKDTADVLRDTTPITKTVEEDPVRDEFVRSRAEKIREQLKKNTLEETPIIPPPSAEEIDNMLNELEKPEQEPSQPPLSEEDKGIFEYLHQVLGVEEDEETAEEPAPVEEMPAEPARPRWFDDAPAPAMPLHHGHVDAVEDDDEYDEYDEYDDFDEENGDTLNDADDTAEETPSRFRHLDDDEEPEEKPENPIVAFFKNLFGKRQKDDDFDEDEFENDELDEELDDEYEDDGTFEDEAFGDEEDVTETSGETDSFEEDFEEAPDEEPETEEIPEEEPEIEEAPEEEPEIEEVPEEPEKEPEIGESFEDTADSEDDFDEDEDFEDDEDTEDDFEEDYLDDAPTRSVKRSGFFREAFDESAEELADLKAEPVPEPEREIGVKQRFLSRNSYFVAGIIVFLLALVGLVTLISGLVKVTGGFFSGGSLKSQLENALYPVAVVDVPSFNEPAELTADGALSAAIVDILMHDDLSGYTETFDMISVPAADVLERGREMFGVDVQTQLDTLHAAGESFVYDAQTQCYNVPTAPMIFSYSPEVKNIKRTGDTYEVTVIYHSDVADWQENSRNFREGSTKTMQATIEKKSTGYRIVRLVPAE